MTIARAHLVDPAVSRGKLFRDSKFESRSRISIALAGIILHFVTFNRTSS